MRFFFPKKVQLVSTGPDHHVLPDKTTWTSSHLQSLVCSLGLQMFKSFCVVLVYVFGLQTFKSFCVVSVSVCLLALLNVQIILCSLQTMQNVLPNGWLTLRKMTLTSCKVSFPSVIVFLPPALTLTLQPANGLMMLNCYKAAVWGGGGISHP